MPHTWTEVLCSVVSLLLKDDVLKILGRIETCDASIFMEQQASNIKPQSLLEGFSFITFNNQKKNVSMNEWITDIKPWNPGLKICP